MRARTAALSAVVLACGLLFGSGRVPVASGQPLQPRPVLETGVYEGVPWPIIPSPIWPLPAPPRATEPPPPPETPAGVRILEVLERVRATARDNRYEHTTRIRERDGVYRWDCSAMTAWVLARAAPTAMRVITQGRPVARDFVRAMERAPTTRAARGWQRIARLEDARPGDLFSWRRPRGFPSRNTGHVGFIVDRPLAVRAMPGAFAVRVADATSLAHQNDTRDGDPDGGFGYGTLVFLTDDAGRGSSYGWFGTASVGYVVTPIVIGRVTR